MIIFRNIEERLFAHKRKQNRRMAAASHNAEMHANRANKKANKANKALLKGNLEQAEQLNATAEKSLRAAKIDSNRVADEVVKASKQRKSISNTPAGLAISNQGAGNMVVSKNEVGNVRTVRVSPKKSGNIVTTTTANKVPTDKVVSKEVAKQSAKVSPKVIVENTKSTGKTIKTSTDLVAKKVGRTKKAIDFGKSVKGLSPKAKIALGLGTAAVVGGATAYKLSKKKTEKV